MPSINDLRQFKIAGYAVFDLVLAFVGVYLLSPILSKLFLKVHLKIPKRSWVLLVLPIGIIAHLLVGTITPMTADFITPNSHYTLKIAILTLCILAAKDIRFVKKAPKK